MMIDRGIFFFLHGLMRLEGGNGKGGPLRGENGVSSGVLLLLRSAAVP